MVLELRKQSSLRGRTLTYSAHALVLTFHEIHMRTKSPLSCLGAIADQIKGIQLQLSYCAKGETAFIHLDAWLHD